MDNDQSLAGKLSRLALHLSQHAEREEEAERRAVPSQMSPSVIGAEEHAGERGRFWIRSIKYDPTDPWGEVVPGISCPPEDDLSLRIPFDGLDEAISLTDCLFVDCETTGLSGGAGTVSFLTAVGQLTESGFIVDQFFLPDLADEAGKLDAVAERFNNAKALVTYNGSAFDLPLLEGRFHFWRIDASFRALPHLDLLWPTRAIFKQRINECTLSNVEARLLKFARVEDLPGAEVPEVYFQYLRDGFSPRLHAVMEHNRLDVVSLFVYAHWLMQQTHPHAPSLADPDDLFALAWYWYRKRRLDAAVLALDASEERVLGPSQKRRLAELRGRILKRARRYDDAHSHWEKLAKRDPNSIEAVEELAKHLEHRHRDYQGALEVVDRALERIRMREALSDIDLESERQSLLYRRARLVRRLAKKNAAE